MKIFRRGEEIRQERLWWNFQFVLLKGFQYWLKPVINHAVVKNTILGVVITNRVCIK